jgi:ferric-dicitrate binding protein FerR (iron transport regulator)
VSFWDGALGDDALAARQKARYERWRERLGHHVEAAQRAGRLPAAVDPGELAATAAAFAHGLVVQALFAPADFPPDLQARLLDTFLSALGALSPNSQR